MVNGPTPFWCSLVQKVCLKIWGPRLSVSMPAGVLIAQRWILAVLRHRTFFSLGELNATIRECLERLNTRPLRRLGKSRRDLFETIDRPSALPLPERPYE